MLTRSRRQVLATLALIGFTVAPSAYVAYNAHRVRRPSHLREVEAEVGRRLGVLVSVARATHPRPDVDQLDDVSLRLETARHSEIAHADTLRVTRGAGELTLRVGELALRGGEAPDLLGHVLTLMRRLASSDGGRIALVADRGVVGLGDRREAVHDLAAILQAVGEVPTLTASYLVADEARGSRTRCELMLSRSAGPGGVRTTVVLKTMDGSVPARVLAPFFDPESWLGSSARLEGTLTLNRREGGAWEADFRGALDEVDLASVVGRRFAGHRLSGRARLALDSARWAERAGGQGPGWVEARGAITAGPGTISMGLLRALESRMRFRLANTIDPRKADVEFQAFGLSFAMDSAGELKLGGALGAEYSPDAVLVQGSRPLPLARSPEGAANVRGLWNTLIPAAPETLAPAVSEAHALRSLPLPAGRSGPVSAN